MIIFFYIKKWFFQNIQYIEINQIVSLQMNAKYWGLLWSCSYGSWIYNYLCNQCLLPLTLWVQILFMARCSWYNEILLKVVLNTITQSRTQSSQGNWHRTQSTGNQWDLVVNTSTKIGIKLYFSSWRHMVFYAQ